MKKLLLLLSLTFVTFAFSQRVQERDKQFNVGIVFNTNFDLPIYAGLDYGLTDYLTTGGQITFATKNKTTWLGLGGNLNLHINDLLDIPNDWDVYGGIALEYNKFYYKGNKTNGDFDFTGQIGVRYYFSSIGVNAEFGGIGVDDGNFKAGLSIRF